MQVEDKDLSSSDCRHTVFVEETVSSLVCILAYLSKIRWLSCVSFSLGPLFYPITLCMHFLCQYHIAFITIALSYNLKSDTVITPFLSFL